MVYGVINGHIKRGEQIHIIVEMDQIIMNSQVVLIADLVNRVDKLMIIGLHNKDVMMTNGVQVLDIVEKLMNTKTVEPSVVQDPNQDLICIVVPLLVILLHLVH
jgi:hypothetical protein